MAGNASAEVTFLLPSSNGNNRITLYDVEAHPTNRIYACRLTDCEVRGLTNGKAYFFTVAAVNKLGTGPFSFSSNKVTPHILRAKVTFNPNGGSGAMANETENYNVATDLTANAFSDAGHTFNAWNTVANGTGVAYADNASYAFTANTTLYAQWTINSYTVTFNPNGGSGAMANETENYNVATDLTANAFSDAGHTFNAWNTVANGTGVAYADNASYAFTANTTLYAQWTIVGAISTNWSGYVLRSNSAVFTQVSAGWRVPQLNCTDIPNSQSATWVGTGGANNAEALLQTGTENSCVGGVQQEAGWFELFPSNPNQEVPFSNFPVNAGDSMFATVGTNSVGEWETILKDLTTGREGIFTVGSGWVVEFIATNTVVGSFQATDSNASYSGAYSAEWIVEDPTDSSTLMLSPFANYGTVTFTNLGTNLPVLTLSYGDSYEIVQGASTLSVPTVASGDSFSCSYTGP